MEVHRRFLCVALPLVLIYATTVSAGPGLDQLRGALGQWDAELGSNSDRQQRWRDFCRHDVLQNQVAQGENADVETVKEIRRQFFYGEQAIPVAQLQILSQSLERWATDIEDEKALDAAVDTYEEVISAIRREKRQAVIWKNFFRGEEIQDLIDEETAADAESVRAIVSRLRAEAENPNRENFTAVRRSLTHWIAELENPVKDDLAVAARREKVNYQPIDSGQLQAAKDSLMQALLRLDRFLSRDAEKSSSWKSYLGWKRLANELHGNDLPSWAVVSAAYTRFNSGEPGLELEYFDDVKDALRQYRDLLRLAETAPHRIAQSMRNLNDAVNSLDLYLISGGERKERGWKEFLDWDDLQEELAEEQPDGRVLRRILDQYRSGEDGLDLQPFQLVERRIRKHIELLQLARSSQAQDIYAAQLEELAKALEQHRAQPTVDSAAKIITGVRWLHGAGQANRLVARVRSVHMRPNLIVRAPGKLITQRLNSTQSQQTPIGRCFEGAWVTGQAQTNANISGRLLPCDAGVLIEVVLSGKTLTGSVGTKRKVNVYSRGTTHIEGSKRLLLTPDGLSDSPAVASAQTSQSITGVNVNRKMGERIVTRLATRKALKLAPQAASEASFEARTIVAKQMDEQARDLVQQANEQLREKVREPLQAEGLYPESIHMQSSDSDVNLVARINREDSLTAPNDPPPVTTNGDDLSLRVHQSAINNQLVVRLADRKIDNQIVLQLLEENDLKVPDELKPIPKTDGSGEIEPPEEWSLTFDTHQPVEIVFDGNLIRVGVMGRQFTREGQEIAERIRISAAYSIHPEGRYIRFNRESEVEVDFVASPDRLSTSQLAYKTFMLRKVGSLFPETISTEELPRDEASDQVSELLETIDFKTISTAAGWLAIDAEVDADALMTKFPQDR